MNWNDVKLFLALVRGGTVRKAAVKAGVSHSTVARRIEAFEKKLGVRLFERLADGYTLTQPGEDMLRAAENVENELDALERRIVGQDRRLAGNIRFTMIDVLATSFLMPHLTQFSHTYPDIDLEVVITYEALDLSQREADIALRFVQNPPQHLIGRRLMTAEFMPYASVEYLKHHSLQDPVSDRWIGFESQSAFPKWVRESNFPNIPAKGVFSSLLLQLEAAKTGMGIGMLPSFLGDDEPNLRRLPHGEVTQSIDLWLLTHRDLRTTARIRVFSDFIANAVKNHREALAKQPPKYAEIPDAQPVG